MTRGCRESEQQKTELDALLQKIFLPEVATLVTMQSPQQTAQVQPT
jgi:hypothetical protein